MLINGNYYYRQPFRSVSPSPRKIVTVNQFSPLRQTKITTKYKEKLGSDEKQLEIEKLIDIINCQDSIIKEFRIKLDDYTKKEQDNIKRNLNFDSERKMNLNNENLLNSMQQKLSLEIKEKEVFRKELALSEQKIRDLQNKCSETEEIKLILQDQMKQLEKYKEQIKQWEGQIQKTKQENKILYDNNNELLEKVKFYVLVLKRKNRQ